QFWQARGHAQNFESLQCRILIDDQMELEAPLFSLTVANQKFDNPLTDNRLVVTMIDRPSGRQLTSYLWNVVKKDQVEEGFTRFGAKKVVIETTPTTGVMIDGKLTGRTPI